MISFKEGFKRARKKTGLSQSEFAEKYHYSLATVKKWEQGKAVPEYENLVSLCEIFHCDTNYLFAENELPTRDLQYIHDQTGLTIESIEAIRKLRKFNQTDWILDAFNAIVTSDDFDLLLLYVVKYETAGDKEAVLPGKGESGKYLLKDIYKMKIIDILGGILDTISSVFENREDYRRFYRTMLDLYKTPNPNGKCHSIDDFRKEIENAGLVFDQALFEGE